MRFKFKTLQASLFIQYSSFFIIILLIIGLVSYSFFSKYITNKVLDQQVGLCTSIVSSLDSEVAKMNTVSMSILYSNLLKDFYLDYLSLSTSGAKDNALIYSKSYSNMNSLIDVITAILGPLQSVSQANIYDFKGNMVGAGIFNGKTTVDVKKKEWYKKTLLLNGSKYITVPEHIRLLNPSNSEIEDHEFVSLCRIYEDRTYKKLGIVEIVQDCDTLFKFINDLKGQNDILQIYIINSEGNSIYPYKSLSSKNSNYYKNIITKGSLSPLILHNIKNPSNKSTEIMTYTTSENSGFQVIVVESKKAIFTSLNAFSKTFILFLIFVIAMTLFMSFIVARNVTIPLKKLRHALRNMEIEDLISSDTNILPVENNSLNEIERLNKSYNTMNEKLSKSLSELLNAKSEEMNARLLAIQSQMNPHFLHNNLANISVMAEEGMNGEIVSLCNDVSFMLRYISEESKTGIDLFSEIDYTQKYLNCMKIRYEENLIYNIELQDTMGTIIVPKLIVQPLVENSMKYGLNSQPPWCISVHGSVVDNNWRITVTDTGTGFDNSVLLQFDHFIDNLKDFSTQSHLQIGGMGLLNICMRLKLIYKDNAVFLIKNLPTGGASVTIGGTIYRNII